MILAATAEATFGASNSLPLHELHGYIPLPFENHRLFGAGFLLVSVLLMVETLAGGVWFRRGWRRDIWPGVLMVLGWGLVVVAFIEPADKVIHLLMGTMLIGAGFAERRYRYGEMSLAQANIFVIPALLAGGMEIGVFHSHGSWTDSEFMVHALLGITAAMIAPARFYWAQEPQSMWRSAIIAILVLVLAFELLGLSHGNPIDVHNGQSVSS